MNVRLQLSRKKGWRMPSNAVKVDRATRWGNPFIVGRDGSAPLCVYWFIMLLGGYQNLSVSRACFERQEKFLEVMKAEKRAGYPRLRGKILACWCNVGHPCHADVLLEIANKPARRKLNLGKIMKGFGYRVMNGGVERIRPEGSGAKQ